MENQKRNLLPAFFFLAQGLLGLVWWIGVGFSSELREAFFPKGFPDNYLLYFWLPDLILFVGGSVATGVALLVASRKAIVLSSITLGAVAYAALFTACTSLATESAFLALIMMGVSLLCTLLATTVILKS